MPAINAERLLKDLHDLRKIGAVGVGVVRPAFSTSDMEAREWLRHRFIEAGLESSIDGIGNVLGKSKNAGPAILIGSHSDTQPEGGWLDGALGVIYALEIARACAENKQTHDLAIDTMAWQEEEGAFKPLLGSSSFFGMHTSDDEVGLVNNEGTLLVDAIKTAGLDGIPRHVMEKDRYVGYLEGHIEQGPYLDIANEHIGVITGIIGAREYTIKFHGEQNHAGTNPMSIRKDAGAALIEFSHQIHQGFSEESGEYSVWNIANVKFEPGASSIVPGYAELLMQFRDQDEGILLNFEEIIHQKASRINDIGKVRVEVLPPSFTLSPTPMEESFQNIIAKSAETHAPKKWRHMPSGAGHDTIMAHKKLPCGMLFIPSIDGISHSFTEDTNEKDIVIGCQVLADSAVSILENSS